MRRSASRCSATSARSWAVIEFVARVVLAERRGQYAARHVPDVLMVALPALRPLRLLRFLVLLRMINRRATASLHGRIVAYVVASAGLVLLISTLAMLEAERHNPQANIRTFGDALWWALSTMSTVGYGDRVPTTGDGRVIGAGLMLAGIALLGVITATFAWLIAQVRETETEAPGATRDDIAELRAEIAHLSRTVAQRDAESAS
jgi:voltage-gated potassium channel